MSVEYIYKIYCGSEIFQFLDLRYLGYNQLQIKFRLGNYYYSQYLNINHQNCFGDVLQIQVYQNTDYVFGLNYFVDEQDYVKIMDEDRCDSANINSWVFTANQNNASGIIC
jgi:hypothetical protein